MVEVETAENSKNSRFKFLAIIRARVVLPLPGGPQKIKEGKKSVFFRSFLIMPDLPTKCSWPKNSFRFLGLSFSGKGIGTPLLYPKSVQLPHGQSGRSRFANEWEACGYA